MLLVSVRIQPEKQKAQSGGLVYAIYIIQYNCMKSLGQTMRKGSSQAGENFKLKLTVHRKYYLNSRKA